MNFRINRDGHLFVGVDALTLPRIDAVLDQHGNELQPLTEAGISTFINNLHQQYEIHDQDQQTAALDRFFETRRGNGQLSVYITNFRLHLQRAEELAGLNINAVAQSYVFLRWSGIPMRRQEDLKLQIAGDMARFEDLVNITQRIAKAEIASGHSTGYHVDNDYDNVSVSDASWTKVPTYYEEYYDNEYYDENDEYEYAEYEEYYDETYDWGDDETYYDDE